MHATLTLHLSSVWIRPLSLATHVYTNSLDGLCCTSSVLLQGQLFCLIIKWLFKFPSTRLRKSKGRHSNVKVDFPIVELDGSRNGVEGLWCISRGGYFFEVDNIPFAVRGVSLGDLVECHWNGKCWVFLKVKEKSGLCCARIYSEYGIDLKLWGRVINGLDVKYEFASEARIGVAATPDDMATIIERSKDLDEIFVEITADVRGDKQTI